MQNQGPPYQGPVNQGSFPDHSSYNNQMAAHCPPSGYQPYVNGPYPIGNPRGRHYGNHQLQQGPPPNQISYRGNYAPPPPGQYGPPPPNQDMYRNHHPVYIGSSNRNYHGKAVWGDNNSADMMPYNHGPSHPQMINNSTPINVSSMRSPPHLAASVNPVSSPGSQHYRQMQSPGHSPQTWPQVQVPSPGMHPVARTTPSPLQTHARSPGHSQPFSPSAATHLSTSANMPSHPIPSVVPENAQPTQTVNQGMSNVMTPGPLHSIQKMVMLQQDTNPMQLNCELSNENNCDRLSVCSSNSVSQAEQNPHEDLKDSSFATYYNLDENRLESEPHATAFKSPDFALNSSVGEVSCSPQALITNNNDEHSSEVSKVSDTTPKRSRSSYSNMPVTCRSENVACNTSVSTDVPNGLSKCLPDAVTSHKDTQCLSSENPSKDKTLDNSNTNSLSKVASEVHLTAQNQSIPEPVPHNISKEENQETISSSSIKSENSGHVETMQCDEPVLPGATENTGKVTENSSLNKVGSSSTLVTDDQEQKEDKSLVAVDVVHDTSVQVVKSSENTTNVLPNSSNSEKLQENESNISSQNVNNTCEVAAGEEAMQQQEIKTLKQSPTTGNGKSKLVAVNSRTSHKVMPDGTVITTESDLTTNGTNVVNAAKSRISASDIARNPVKVVIHRIRTNNTSDTWHVPKSSGNAVSDKQEKVQKLPNDGGKTDISSRVSKIGPQIIILSPAMSRKKFGIATSGNPKSVITIKKEKAEFDVEAKPIDLNVTPISGSPKKKKKVSNPSEVPQNSLQQKEPSNSVRKKRGRPCGSASKLKSSPTKKKHKGKQKKNLKKRKPEISEIELPPKPKKLKPFTGPYVRVTGSKASPSSITVVNVALKEEERGKNLRTKTSESVVKRPRVGHTSTLSPHYDAFNKDRTWLCAFCHKGSHSSGLGDLYGPYYVKDDIPLNSTGDSSTTSPSSNRGVRSKRRRSDASVNESAKASPRKTTKHANKGAEQSDSLDAAHNTSTQQTQSQNELASKEVWIHEDCAVWCQGVSLMGSQILGLEEAIQEAKENICSYCKLNGATVGCWCKGCKEQFHFCCAKEKGCKLDIENFSLFCPKHKDVRCVEKQKRTL